MWFVTSWAEVTSLVIYRKPYKIWTSGLAVSFMKAHVSALRLSLSFPVLCVYVYVCIHVTLHADALLLVVVCVYVYIYVKKSTRNQLRLPFLRH